LDTRIRTTFARRRSNRITGNDSRFGLRNPTDRVSCFARTAGARLNADRKTILAFYSGDGEYAEQAVRSLRGLGVGTQFFRPQQDRPPAENPYALLRFGEEELIVVEADLTRIASVLKTLRSAGEPGVFFESRQIAPPARTEGILGKLNEYERVLKAIRNDLIEAIRADHTVTESGKWFLDNTHLLRTSIAEIRNSLPKGFRRALARYISATGNLYICELASRVVAEANNALTDQLLSDAVAKYQVERPFSIAELWAFPVMLRFALVEVLEQLAERISAEQQIRETAYLWANRLIAASRASQQSIESALAQMETRPMARQPYFAICLIEQLQDEEAALVPAQQWIEAQLGARVSDLVGPEHNREAAETLSIANAFNSLRAIARMDFTEFFEKLNVVGLELQRDPAGTYARSDFRTRDRCRRAVESLACRTGLSEPEVARRAVEAAERATTAEQREVCWHLLAQGLIGLEKELKARVPIRIRLVRMIRDHATFFYLSGVFAVTLCCLLVALSIAYSMGVGHLPTLIILGILALFPLSELAVQIVNALIISAFQPESLSKLDFDDGIPGDQATLVVVPMMLSSHEVVRLELEKLEVRFLANQDPNLWFSLFSDFRDAPEQAMPDDAELVAIARDGIEDLNRRYKTTRFLLFHRERVWSETEGRWIGRERKRGKIEELNRFLRAKPAESPDDGSILRAGARPEGIRYVITLDADTQLPPGSARRMVGTIAHPLNRPVLDPETKVRIRGYSIIQPRVSIGLPGATASRFTRIFADTSGTDPYCSAVSDAQQDLFGEAIFHGKAIYDVEAFGESVGNRFPAETLLSHDLIEGSYAGVGLATDIELFESMPLDYASFCRRTHRWIRGDWQIASWIMRHVPAPQNARVRNPLSAVSRWRILDNLRRSLVPVASILLLLAGWMISAAPGAWSLIVGLAIAIPAIAPLLERLAHRIQGTVIGWQGAHDELLRAVVLISFLPHQAWLSSNAIGKVIYRRYVSHRNLLEWQTAERAAAESRTHMSATMRQMAFISAGSVVLTLILLARHAFAPVSAFVLLWIGSPALLHWLNLPSLDKRQRRILLSGSRMLRSYARQTWRFFDDLVNDSTNWLPPDNTQTALHVEVANRTSPTNIGLWLCSALAARDFGYITPDDLLNRTTKTMDTIQRLTRYEGHLLNWYNTTTTEPLSPRYVSTVDSGNLLASLWVFAQGIHDILHAPILGQQCVRGLWDTLAQIEDSHRNDPSVAVPLQTLRKLLRGKSDTLSTIGRLRMATVPAEQLTHAGGEATYWAARFAAEVQAWNGVVDRYLKWFETLTYLPDFLLEQAGEDAVQLRHRVLNGKPSLIAVAEGDYAPMRQLLSLRNVRGGSTRVQAWFAELDLHFQEAQRYAAQAVRDWRSLSARCLEFASSTNMGFLFDPKRKLFGIGYLVGGPVEFNSHYDLLASECRVASLVAIAKGDVPIEHWFTLGRPMVSRLRSHVPKEQTLLSWTGTMFEYLMPLLFTKSYDNSLLDGACRNAVAEQIEWGREKNLPWGVSECAWSALDMNQTYQYHAFGIPALSLRPGLDEENVVAPYATMLALLIDPGAAIDNLEHLRKLGLEGPMGFYEAVDFTRERTAQGGRGVVIYTYMSHHQGMTLLALDNILHRDAMQRRFHADRRIRAIEPLLFERVPTTPLPAEDMRTGLTAPVPITVSDPADRVWRENTAVPRVHLYGNGRYCLMVTNSGGGYSRWKGFDVTRWRSDPACDNWGSFLYIRDLKAQFTWSAAYQPLGGGVGSSSVRFLPDHTEYHRRALDIETITGITVAPEDDAELRRVTITNWSSRIREIELTSYCELALAPHPTDTAHPAFAKMFIQTEYVKLEDNAALLMAHRRLRSPEDEPIWTGHMLLGAPAAEVQYETDRATFLGRGNSPGNPVALRRDLNSSAGTVIDPIFSLRYRAELSPRDRLELTFITFAAGCREDLLALAERYRRHGAVTQAFELTWTRSQLQFRYLGIGTERAHRFQELASYLIYPNPRLRPADRVARNRLGQPGLWAFGISGDLPTVCVTVSDERYLNFVREILQAHTYWRLRGFRADCVVLNQEAQGYDTPLRYQLQKLMEAHSVETGIDIPGGVFLRDWHAMPEEGRNLLLASSAVVLSGSRGSLQQQLAGVSELSASGARLRAEGRAEEPSRPLPFLELPYFNGQGGFSKDGREYAIYLKPGDNTPAPWVNVMANRNFGSMITESGLGFTWRGNSQMNRLTPWNNDPVSDTPSEVLYLRDEENGSYWSPTPQPIRENDAYRARHGQGYSVFEHNSHSIGQLLTIFVPVDSTGSGEPVKIIRLRLRNDSSRPRKLSATYFATLVLGGVREDNQLHVCTSRDQQSGALFATQYRHGPYAGYVTFAASSPAPTSWSGDRTQFLGRNKSVRRPAAMDRTKLDNRVGAALDPAIALQIQVSLDVGAETEVIFLLGQAENAEEAREVLTRCKTTARVNALFDETKAWWDDVLGTLQVKTPLLSADLLLNRWLLYQSLSCRFWGRSAFYQSSGAMGFRDQLQDSLAFVHAAPQLTRAHILFAASRQFLEGDVQHWWHAETGMGVRTRCSDDLVWLPYVVAHYVETTGDRSVLHEPVPFLEAPLLAEGEMEHLSTPLVTVYSAPLWEHCRRALDKAGTLGEHGLPLIGNGDWNDGLNHVGPEGKGESVWLAWFLGSVLRSFADVMESEGEGALANSWRDRGAMLAEATEKNAWDGEWYLRAYFDDGSPLGSHANAEARIDSLPQSWAVISGLGQPARARTALESASDLLVDRVNNLVHLFTPPFDHSTPHPGYIMGYPPGLRENGGQYTHGSLWMALAWARLGQGARATELLTMMNPVEHTRTPADVAKYCGEPYAVAADVSSGAGREGRAGWTDYTGSAAWMYRIWTEEVLGLKVRGDRLQVKPAIPDEWPGFEMTLRYRTSTYEIRVQRGAAQETLVDGRKVSDIVVLRDDGSRHQVLVVLPLHQPEKSGMPELAVSVHV